MSPPPDPISLAPVPLLPGLAGGIFPADCVTQTLHPLVNAKENSLFITRGNYHLAHDKDQEA